MYKTRFLLRWVATATRKLHREKCLSKAQFLKSNIQLTLNSFEIWPVI